jgi:hypothetical protein
MERANRSLEDAKYSSVSGVLRVLQKEVPF